MFTPCTPCWLLRTWTDIQKEAQEACHSGLGSRRNPTLCDRFRRTHRWAYGKLKLTDVQDADKREGRCSSATGN